MSALTRTLLLAAVAVVLCSGTAAAMLTFNLADNREQCFAYEATRRSHEEAVKVAMHYRFLRTPPAGAAVSVTVRGPTGVRVTEDQLHVRNTEPDFTVFTAVMSGLFRVCFKARGASGPLPMELEFGAENDHGEHLRTHDGTAEVHAVPAAASDDYHAAVARIKQHIEVAGHEVLSLVERQAEFDAVVSSTHWRVVVFTGINLVTVLAAGAWQVMYLIRFFKAKKVV